MRQTPIVHDFGRIIFDNRDAFLLPLRFEMSSLKEMQAIDRELSSELVESPINPAFFHMSFKEIKKLKEAKQGTSSQKQNYSPAGLSEIIFDFR